MCLGPNLRLGNRKTNAAVAVKIEPLPGGVLRCGELAAPHRINLAGDVPALASTPGTGPQSSSNMDFAAMVASWPTPPMDMFPSGVRGMGRRKNIM